jgi:serine/threonine protein kinase/tetratricopeptide (TPR) repeat protein
MPTDPSRGLLFAIFAIHLDFITRDQLTAAIAEWIRQPSRPIAQILVDQKALDPRTREIVEDVVARHLEQHGGDAERSIANLGAKGLIPPELAPALGGSMTSDAATSASAGVEGADASDPISLSDYAAGGTRYRVLRPQDRGGMGEVFVARDLELGREVLLKQLPERRADDPQFRAAFLKEIRAGAALEHPGIAPVYDVGQYPGGRLFEVMRLIPGGTFQRAIRDHHDSRGSLPEAARVLRFRELLGHFVDACQAIEYAHSRGVLHRDIKPSNIMLGSFGETQVIDWGLARIVGHDLSDGRGSPAELISPEVVGEGSHPTEDGQFKGTPAYASPEQADGKLDLVDARSDVYSLGATLYCLLTDAAPFHVRSPLILDDVRKGRFPRPRLMNADVPPALESICLKAMAKAQGDRYQSPRDLATDVERWLADEPVLAHPDPFSVRLRRWGLRHRTAVAAAVALLLTSVVGLGIGYAAVKEQRDVARKNATIAKDVVSEFLLDYANEVLPAIPESDKKRLELTGRAVAIGRRLVARFPEDPDLAKGLARAILEFANIRRSMNLPDDTESLYEEATRMYERLLQRYPTDNDLRTSLIVSRSYHSIFARVRGALPEAEALALKTVEIADGFPDSSAVGKAGARAKWALADTLALAGRRDDALRWMEEACRSATDVAAGEGASVDDRSLATLINAEAARMFRGAGRNEAARSYSEAALTAAEALGDRPDAEGLNRPMTQQVLAESLREWAIDRADDVSESLEALGRAITIVDELVDDHPDIVSYRSLLVGLLNDRGETLCRMNRFEPAAADAERAVREGENLIKSPDAAGEPPPDDVAMLRQARELAARVGRSLGRQP